MERSNWNLDKTSRGLYQDNVKTVNSYLLVMVNVQRTGFVKLNWVSLG